MMLLMAAHVAKALPRLLAALAFALGCSSAFAGTDLQEDPDGSDKAWRELALQLPAAPLQENLLPFHVGPSTTQRFAIDAKSISVGKDGVVRYTMVSIGSGGARNVSYEGLRCATLEKRLYAFGRADGSWSRSRRESWDPIGGSMPSRQHATLFNDFLCNGKIVAGSAEQIAVKLRREGGLGMQGKAAPDSD